MISLKGETEKGKWSIHESLMPFEVEELPLSCAFVCNKCNMGHMTTIGVDEALAKIILFDMFDKHWADCDGLAGGSNE